MKKLKNTLERLGKKMDKENFEKTLNEKYDLVEWMVIDQVEFLPFESKKDHFVLSWFKKFVPSDSRFKIKIDTHKNVIIFVNVCNGTIQKKICEFGDRKYFVPGHYNDAFLKLLDEMYLFGKTMLTEEPKKIPKDPYTGKFVKGSKDDLIDFRITKLENEIKELQKLVKLLFKTKASK